MKEQNHIAEIIQVANGEMLKKDYAELIGVDPTRLSAKLNDDFARVIKKLQVEKITLQAEAREAQEVINTLKEDCKDLKQGASNMLAKITEDKALINELQAKASELQSTRNQLQANTSKLQADVNNLKDERNTLQESEMELQERISELQGLVTVLQSTCDKLEAANTALQETKAAMQYQITNLESELSHHKGQPGIIRWFGSSSTRAVLAVLLAVFEVAGTIHLLAPKGYLLAVPVGVAMGYSLLAFASAGNAFGKWFCIVFSFAVGAIFFEPWATGLPQDWLFAFVPPVVNAIIVNSFNQKK